jgi:Spy/CpxP family protein refolding chaperone
LKLSSGLALLVTACIALLIVFAALRLRSVTDAPPAFGPPRMFGPPPLFTHENKETVRQQIGITAEQQARIEALYAESDRLRASLHTRLFDRMRESHALYDNYVIDMAHEATLRKEIAGIQDALFQAHVDTERKLREILTPEQFARLHILLSQQRDRSRRDFHSRRPHSSPIH